MDMPFSKVGIWGVGLIGGSIGLALKRDGRAVEVTGIGRSEERLRKACRLGIVDKYACNPDSLQGCELVILATPVEQIVDALGSLGGHLRPGTVVTDVGSTKRMICESAWRSLPETVEFIGGHPVAGREVAGLENSLPGLFDNAAYVFCPKPGAPSGNLLRLESFAEILGARPCVMTPEEHDRAIARVSHLPQLLSTALAHVAGHEGTDISGSGLRDMLRLAGSPYSIWEGIFQSNRDNIDLALGEFIRHLEGVRRLLAQDRLREEFEAADKIQRRIRKPPI